MKQELLNIIDLYSNDDTDFFERTDADGKDWEITEEIKTYLESKHVPYKLETEDMFDSAGCDITAISIAWLENNEIEMLLVRMFCC